MLTEPSTIGVLIITGLAVAVEVGCALRRPRRTKATACGHKCGHAKKAVVVGLLLCAVQVNATPYFRLNPQAVAGAYSGFSGKDKPAYGLALAPFTHSTKDGALFRSVQADWAPLAIGGGWGSEGAFVAAGPLVNLVPAVKSMALNVLDLLDKSGRYPNLRSLLAPTPDGKPDVTISVGPHFLVRPIEGGQILPIARWRGSVSLFSGAALKF